MFGFSLTKLLFTVAVIVFVLYGFKWVGRMQAQRAAEARAALRRDGRPATKGRAAADDDAEDMVKCPVCESYIPARDARSCGRDDCPYPG